jgi:multiple sugar transport system permease protein
MMRRQSRVVLVLRCVLLSLFVIATVFPFYYTMLNSFRDIRDVGDLDFTPTRLTTKNWVKAFSAESNVPRWLLNSLIATFGITTGSLITDTLTGYTFARKRFPGRNSLFLLILSGLTIPIGMLVIPIYVMMAKVELINTYWALILPAASVLGTFMMRQSISVLPAELDEAARLDGCSDLQILWYVIVPLVRPALASVYIVLFLTHWNSFIYPLVVTNKTAMRTLPVGLYLMAPGGGFNLAPPQWGMIMLLASIMIFPVLTVFVFLQDYFTRGLFLTGMK